MAAPGFLGPTRHNSPTKEGGIVLEWDETVQKCRQGPVVNSYPPYHKTFVNEPFIENNSDAD